MPTYQSGSLLEDLIRVEHQLESDTAISYETLQKRDRRIGIEINKLKHQPVKQLQAWLNLVSTHSSTQWSGVTKTKRSIDILSMIAGFIIGSSTALGLFYYTGEQPINIISVLGIGVGLQLTLLCFLILSVLPIQQNFQDALSGFSAGRWLARLANMLPRFKTLFDQLLNRKHRSGYRKIIKYQTVYWSQNFAVMFNVGLVISCLYLVTFSDLAFGWNTTLAVDNDAIKSITDTLSYPWRKLFPAAVPDLGLIESTRFYRLKSGTFGSNQNSILNQAQLATIWWQFLLLCIMLYGFAPRLVVLIFSKHQLNKSIKQSIFSLPGLNLLFDRMNNPSVATSADTPEITANKIQSSKIKKITLLSSRQVHLLHWGQLISTKSALQKWTAETTGATVISFNTIASNSAADILRTDSLPVTEEKQALVVIAKAWEPPTLELTDWLKDLREHYGNQLLIVVLPYEINSALTIKDAASIDNQIWFEFLSCNNSHHAEFYGNKQ